MSIVAIVGGGISGLTAAYYLSKLNAGVIKKIILLEKSSNLGGWIRTSRFEDGTLLEQGPRSIRPAGDSGKTTLELIENLGIESKILPVHLGHPSTKTRLILQKQLNFELSKPIGIKTIFKKIPPFNKPLGLVAVKEFFTSKKEVEDESMYSFAHRRFGQEVADYVIDPLCRGVVAGDAREISVKTILKPLFDAEQKHGSIVKGMIKRFTESRKKAKFSQVQQSHLVKRANDEYWRMWNLEGGLQTLPEAIEKSIRKSGVEIQQNISCKAIRFSDNKVQISLSDGMLSVDHVFSTLKNVIMDHPNLSKWLSQIPSVSVGLVNLEFNGNCLPVEGFGFLVPSNQKSDILGIVFDSCNFPEHNGENCDKTRLSVMMGGRWFQSLFGNPEKADNDFLLRTAITAVNKHLGISQLPVKHEVHILGKCIPQYVVGHTQRVTDIRKYVEDHKLPLTLIGSSYDGVSVNDCIHNSKKNVEKYLDLP
uniref:Protoporphyrinogen oxidase n=1 Tax=Strigamia maritima TaxID=126957 RepID=T1IT59_STRMM